MALYTAIELVLCSGEYTTTGAMLRPLIHAQTDASSMSLRDEQTKVGPLIHAAYAL